MRDIALVGHGMSLIGQDLGGYIDSHEDVLKFAKDPDNAIAVMDAEDFGERCDILMFTESGSKRLWKDPRSRIEEIDHWVYDKRCGPDLDWLNKYRKYGRRDRARHMSRGTAAVIMAAKAGYSDINIFGFDNIVSGNNDHYMSCFRNIRLTPRYHDYIAEWRVIEEVCREYKVRLECYPKN